MNTNIRLVHHYGVAWCKTYCRYLSMASITRPQDQKSKQAAPRASITFPPDLYQTLEAIAKSKKVSVAWVVRDAAEKYVADQWPLFERVE